MSKVRVATACVVLTLALTGCATGAGAAGSSGGAATADDSAARIVSTVCTRCHTTDRIKAAAHDAAGWRATVARMRGKGAALTDAQMEQVVRFLASGGASQL